MCASGRSKAARPQRRPIPRFPPATPYSMGSIDDTGLPLGAFSAFPTWIRHQIHFSRASISSLSWPTPSKPRRQTGTHVPPWTGRICCLQRSNSSQVNLKASGARWFLVPSTIAPSADHGAHRRQGCPRFARRFAPWTPAPLRGPRNYGRWADGWAPDSGLSSTD